MLDQDFGENEQDILGGLATATRLMARQHDAISENSFRRIVELSPEEPASHYSLGLYCKTRGLFKEGMLANQKGIQMLDEPGDGYLWNFGICATGAGYGELALKVWKDIGNKIEMGRYGLPEGRYPSCKVKLAEFPLSERSKDNDYPGLEETVWIERLSPCHGIIRSVLYQDLGINYGDVILIDGAPITYHKYGEDQIPVFPHLATLHKNDYQHYEFAAIQESDGQISDITLALEGDSVVYSHSENFRTLCSSCWLDPDNDHEQHERAEKKVIKGKIAAANDKDALALLAEIDEAIKGLVGCRLYSPQLCKAAGLEARATIESRRFDMLENNT